MVARIFLAACVWSLPALGAVLKNSVADNARSDLAGPNLSGENVTRAVALESTLEETSGGRSNRSLGSDELYSRSSKVNSIADSGKNAEAEPRKKKEKDMMTRILPMMIIPFMLQTAIIPMMLTMLKIMLIKSAFIGKMAILLGLVNMFRNNANSGGVYTHNINLEHEHMHQRLAQEHYGYTADEEYGAYVNKRGYR